MAPNLRSLTLSSSFTPQIGAVGGLTDWNTRQSDKLTKQYMANQQFPSTTEGHVDLQQPKLSKPQLTADGNPNEEPSDFYTQNPTLKVVSTHCKQIHKLAKTETPEFSGNPLEWPSGLVCSLQPWIVQELTTV